MFKLGDVIRYGSGETALMRVDQISEGHGGQVARYYGQQFYGGVVGAYHDDCRAASPVDLQNWENHDYARTGPTVGESR